MKISLSWLKDYVDISVSVSEIAEKLTMAGLEVEGIANQGAALNGVIAVQIVASEKHPNAEKLSVTQVDTGSGTLQIVCGAKNFKVGDKVPLAQIGTNLPNGMSIKQAKMRDVESNGMLCSSTELGLPAAADGLLILPADATIGAPIATVLGIDDVVLELNVTPNRGDALSHLGVAREVAALLKTPLKIPEVRLTESSLKAADKVAISLEDSTRCLRYAARVIEGVKVGPSPAYIQERLKSCGVRAINNVVDVTNYVLMEYGQPLHAFDLDCIAGPRVIVRTATAGEKLVTLDGKERELNVDDLVIADAKGPLVIAGVMGGASSEVTPKTTRILLECASFQGATVRRSSKRHALKSESSHRFERGTDVNAIEHVLNRAAQLLVECAGGVVLSGIVDEYPKKVEPKVVSLRASRPSELLGLEMLPGEFEPILQSLGFKKVSVGRYEVPGARTDISIEEDLIEEMARIKGFENIPASLPRGLQTLEPEKALPQVERKMRSALAGQQFDEVVNYSFVSSAELQAVEADKDAVVISNPLSVEQGVMRTTLIPSLVANVARAARHQAQGVRFYEWAKSYRSKQLTDAQAATLAKHRLGILEADEKAQLLANILNPKWSPTGEVLEVAGVVWGQRGGGRTWTQTQVPEDFYDAKASVESLLTALNISGASFLPLEVPHFHPRASASIKVGNKVIGSIGELHPRAAKKLNAPDGIYLFQLEVAALVQLATLVPQAKEISSFPSVLRDLAVVVDADMSCESVKSIVLAVGAPLVTAATLFDDYRGPQLGANKKNLAFALSYSSTEKTLTDIEVTEAHKRIVNEVTSRLGGTLRA
jgi:phenylalanyl-tRNA synthetase beta chain